MGFEHTGNRQIERNEFDETHPARKIVIAAFAAVLLPLIGIDIAAERGLHAGANPTPTLKLAPAGQAAPANS